MSFNLKRNNNVNYQKDHNDDNVDNYYWISLLSTSPEKLINDVLSDNLMLHALRMLPSSFNGTQHLQ